MYSTWWNGFISIHWWFQYWWEQQGQCSDSARSVKTHWKTFYHSAAKQSSTNSQSNQSLSRWRVGLHGHGGVTWFLNELQDELKMGKRNQPHRGCNNGLEKHHMGRHKTCQDMCVLTASGRYALKNTVIWFALSISETFESLHGRKTAIIKVDPS